MVRKQAYKENRELRARVGRSYKIVVFPDVPAEEARLMRGPAIAPVKKGYHERSNPFLDRTRPLRIMLDPGMDHSDDSFRNILKLANQSEILELLATSLDPHDIPQNVKEIELEKLENQSNGDHWAAKFKGVSTWVPMFGDYQRVAINIFGLKDEDAAHLAMLTGQTALSLGCDLYLTTNPLLLKARESASGLVADLGPITPFELARLAAVLFRLAGFLPTTSHSTIRGGVYDATIQEWLPSYLPVYRHLCSKNDCDSRILDYMDGLLENCVLSLMALDRLARLHFSEDTHPANNTSVAQQQYESASFVIALISALESLTWILFKLSGAKAHRRQVTFRKLVAEPAGTKDKPWVQSIAQYSPDSLAAFRDGFVPTLELVLHFRDLLQHHVPIPSAVGMFGEIIKVNGQGHFIDKLKYGVLITEPHPGETPCWPKSREAMGVLPNAVMPYPFFRTAIHNLFGLIQDVLSALCSTLDSCEQVDSNPYFSFIQPDTELIKLLTKTL